MGLVFDSNQIHGDGAQKICRKHDLRYQFTCPKCVEGALPVIPKLGFEFPLLPRAFDTVEEADKFVGEWVDPKEAGDITVARVRTLTGSFAFLCLNDKARSMILCGFRELYWRQVKQDRTIVDPERAQG